MRTPSARIARRGFALVLVVSLAVGCAPVEPGQDVPPQSSSTVVAADVPLETQMRDAIEADDAGLTQAILDAGLDLEAEVLFGVPSLHYALQLDRGEIVYILLEAGSAIEACDSQGRTPLVVAASFASADVVEALLDEGADPNAGNPKNVMATPLTYAAHWNNVPALELLLDAGVDIDAVDQGNSTALLYAATRGNLEAVEYLLSRGADPSIRDTDHNATPRDWAAFHGDTAIVDAIDAAAGER